MRYWLYQNGRALSRLLNAFTGGEGDTTYSAYSYYLVVHNKRSGIIRVTVIDWVFGKNHCKIQYEWHLERDLFAKDYD